MLIHCEEIKQQLAESALEAGRARKAYLVAITGESGGSLPAKVDQLLNVPSSDRQRIQEAHITLGHIVCGLIEQLVAGS